jgi:cyclin-dependent kinase regulatory subunit CKS1
MPHYPDEIEYSDKYNDDVYEYRHVILPKPVAKEMYKLYHNDNRQPRLLNEEEWRRLGVTQSRGWDHYEIHKPEPHILLFRRPLGTNPLTGKVDPAPKAAEAANDENGARNFADGK